MYTDYDDLVAQTNSQIEANRKQRFRLRFFKKEGGIKIPLSSKSVRVVQKTSDMLFGVNLGGINRPGVNDYMEKVFNYGTIGTFWKWLEETEGNYDFTYHRAVAQWAIDRGMTLKGHPMLYNLEYLCPDWKFPPTAAQELDHIKRLLAGLGDLVKIWEVVNEPLHVPYTDAISPHFWMKELAPEAQTVINEYGFGSTEFDSFYNILEAVQANNIPFDVVGLQAHCHENGIIPIHEIEEDLEMFSALDKDIHITEITMFADDRPITNPTSDEFTHWTEEAQCKEMEKMYRVLFADPNVKAITNWACCDGDPWRPITGLLRADGSRRPSADMLEDLICNEWNTEETLTTNSRGYCWFTGFDGTYDVYFEGKKVRTITVRDGWKNKKGIRIR